MNKHIKEMYLSLDDKGKEQADSYLRFLYHNQKNRDKDKFIRYMARTGEVKKEEFVSFLMEHYLLEGKSLNDYYNDLLDRYSSNYALACLEHAKKDIKTYVKKKGA